MNYTELGATVVSTAFVITFSYFWRDHRGMIWGMLVNRALMTAASFCFYRHERPRLQFDRSVAKESMGFARYTVPSSLVTLLVSQFDKFVFLKLFPIQMLGLYGLAGNVAGPVDGLVAKIARSVLFPRCAEAFRREPSSVRDKYYSQNVKLVALILFMPAAPDLEHQARRRSAAASDGCSYPGHASLDPLSGRRSGRPLPISRLLTPDTGRRAALAQYCPSTC